jgi:hypothetical protein
MFFYFWVASLDRRDPLRFLVNNSSIDFQQKKIVHVHLLQVYFLLSLGEE